jgi:hypothetical protein
MEWYKAFVPATVSDGKADFLWKGPDAHIGPAETENALLVSLKGKTTNGTTGLAAAIATWGFQRFASQMDVKPYLKFAEAVFLQMPDRGMINVSEVKSEVVPKSPPVVSAIKRIRRLLISAVNPGRWDGAIDQPFRETFHLVYLTRHVLNPAARMLFDAWLKQAIERIDKIAPRPPDMPRSWGSGLERQEIARIVLTFRGQPIPPAAFSPAAVVGDLSAAYEAFATTERKRSNPYYVPPLTEIRSNR